MTHWVPDAHMRLSAKAPGAILRLMQQKLHKEKKKKANCLFQPKVNTTSKLIVDSSDIISSMSFMERQMVFEKLAIFNKNELRVKI
jgi:hypothetical protein